MPAPCTSPRFVGWYRMIERLLSKLPFVRQKDEAIAALLLLLQAERVKNKELQTHLEQVGVLFAPGQEGDRN